MKVTFDLGLIEDSILAGFVATCLEHRSERLPLLAIVADAFAVECARRERGDGAPAAREIDLPLDLATSAEVSQLGTTAALVERPMVGRGCCFGSSLFSLLSSHAVAELQRRDARDMRNVD